MICSASDGPRNKVKDSTKQSVSLDELAKQQGVSAASDLDEISVPWPADDDPDELLRCILLERSERRKPGSTHSGREKR